MDDKAIVIIAARAKCGRVDQHILECVEPDRAIDDQEASLGCDREPHFLGHFQRITALESNLFKEQIDFAFKLWLQIFGQPPHDWHQPSDHFALLGTERHRQNFGAPSPTQVKAQPIGSAEKGKKPEEVGEEGHSYEVGTLLTFLKSMPRGSAIL